MLYTTLIDTEALAQHMGDPDWAVVDCRFDLAKPARGESEYAAAHIPGAVYAHLERDLSGPVDETTGRHPLPGPDRLSGRLGAWGIGPGTQVVAYDDSTGSMAGRLWWLLRWLGHDAVALLDGGWAAWKEATHPIDNQRPQPHLAHFTPRPRNDQVVTTEELQSPGGLDRWQLLDVRTPERFRGESEPIDPVAGHVPGALNAPYSENLEPSGHFLSPARLREHYLALLGDVDPTRVACMCGSGVTACHTLLAMAIAGIDGPRLYAGSWSEWIRDPARPVSTGPERRRAGP
jgi:thiosulfate/3-mercaptopyruvate sulfurtransferase